ncbi:MULTISPECIES: ANTAR domain-containing protein [Rhodococcus]|uniref:ANTAR domain-containing protein n=1 Tax=Rhodococcus TaxID=1827 RepID=UPI001D18999B|nr:MULTISPECIES: ANTAR domain-containing protein [Rhodococcus]
MPRRGAERPGGPRGPRGDAATLAGIRGARGTVRDGELTGRPLRIDEETAGSFNLYSEHDHGFDSLDETLVEVFTTAVETALRQARRGARARAEIAQLGRALRSRPTIDRAVGIVMAARGLTAEEAFAVLVRQSQHENVKLRDIAARLVARPVPTGRPPRPGP